VLEVTGSFITVYLMTDCRLESVALVVDCIKITDELCVVTELARITVGVKRSEVSANIIACVGSVTSVNEWIAFIVYKIAKSANFAVVASVVFQAVVAIKCLALL